MKSNILSFMIKYEIIGGSIFILEKKKGKRTENSERRENIRKLILDYGIEVLSDIKDAIKDY